MNNPVSLDAKPEGLRGSGVGDYLPPGTLIQGSDQELFWPVELQIWCQSHPSKWPLVSIRQFVWRYADGLLIDVVSCKPWDVPRHWEIELRVNLTFGDIQEYLSKPYRLPQRSEFHFSIQSIEHMQDSRPSAQGA